MKNKDESVFKLQERTEGETIRERLRLKEVGIDGIFIS